MNVVFTDDEEAEILAKALEHYIEDKDALIVIEEGDDQLEHLEEQKIAQRLLEKL